MQKGARCPSTYCVIISGVISMTAPLWGAAREGGRAVGRLRVAHVSACILRFRTIQATHQSSSITYRETFGQGEMMAGLCPPEVVARWPMCVALIKVQSLAAAGFGRRASYPGAGGQGPLPGAQQSTWRHLQHHGVIQTPSLSPKEGERTLRNRDISPAKMFFG